MADDYYAAMDEPGEATEPQGEESEGATALLPKTVLGGKDFKPGEEVVLKITHVYEDEVEVEYATEKPKAETPPAPPTDDQELQSLSEKGM